MFSGLTPAMVTPFDEQGEFDLRATEVLVDRFVDAGVSGISALGSTGEFSHLTHPERRRFTEGLVQIVAGRTPLVVGVGSTSTREAVELAAHAEQAGADGLLCLPPFYWKVGEEALYRHFSYVAEAVEIPVLLYNFPMLTGIDLSPDLIARVAREQPNVAGLKDTVTEYSHSAKVIRAVKPERQDFVVLAGFEDQILPTMLSGGDGSICGLANVAPELFVEMVAAVKSGDLERATALHQRVLTLMDLGALSDPPMGAVKLAMQVLGLPVDLAVRGPALPAPPEAREKVEDALRETGLLASRGAARTSP